MPWKFLRGYKKTQSLDIRMPWGKMKHWEFQTLRPQSSLIPLNDTTPMWKESLPPFRHTLKLRRQIVAPPKWLLMCLLWNRVVEVSNIRNIQHVQSTFFSSFHGFSMLFLCSPQQIRGSWKTTAIDDFHSSHAVISFAPIQTENGKHTWKSENYDMLPLWKPRSFSAHRERLAFVG